ncbi:hypothetical protein CLAFUW4_08604 [Fulvia fulva]|uniref:Uncharacterized protein n=1 Tax=Passalora fulva TaxID=5499 RepID=A0A9Q8LDH2_PASFU|nr:uncharacterized protein CLAFUR5_08706 [Fulvia fulva]KAK4629902.1 hypothetical protein CLAFUR0_08602 [Fulvia fulva]UJO15485.1 hypothetical protein CLAFUR5_08706 [Fulvia fulva]WPV13041.1 hypothetical protein CLAFUW4_08604 [Fulvia fulva]
MARAHVKLIAAHPSLSSDTAITTLLNVELRNNDKTQTPILVKLGTTEELDGQIVDLLCPYGATLARYVAREWNDISAYVLAKSSDPDGLVKEWPTTNAVDCFAFHPFAKVLCSLLPSVVQAVLEARDAVEPDYHLPHLLEALEQDWGKAEFMIISFMFQVYMDIHCNMEKVKPDVCTILTAMSSRTKLVMNRYRDFSATSSTPLVDIYLGPGMSRLAKEDFAMVETMRNAANVTKEQLAPSWIGGKPIKLWRDMPALALQEIDHHQMRTCPTGLRVANEGSVVVAMGYVYRAAQHAGTLGIAWRDMDWLLSHHGADRSLVEDVKPGESIAVFLRRYAIALGAPVSMFADPKTRTNLHSIRCRKSRTFDTTSRFFQVARDTVNADLAVGRRTGGWIEVTLQKIFAEKQEQEALSRGRRKADKSSATTHLDLLRLFKSLRADAEKELGFDYISFWIDLAELFAKMRAETAEQLNHFESTKYNVDGLLAAPILAAALDAEIASLPMESSTLGTVGRILQQHIAKKGAVYTTAAQALIEGRVPELWAEEVESPADKRDSDQGSDQAIEQISSPFETRTEIVNHQATVEDVEDAGDKVESDDPDGCSRI